MMLDDDEREVLLFLTMSGRFVLSPLVQHRSIQFSVHFVYPFFTMQLPPIYLECQKPLGAKTADIS